jgi:hypothetical protein
MANSYQQSSSFLKVPTSHIDRVQTIIDKVVKDLKDLEEDDWTIQDGIGCKIEVKSDGVWFYSEDEFNPDHVEPIVKELVEQLEIDEPFYCMWAYYCSKPRIDDFGGGGFLVRRGKDTVWIDAMQHLHDVAYKDLQG